MSALSKPNPFAGLLKAAAALPLKTGAVERYQRRIDSAGSGVVIVADVSSSMAEPAGAARKIDILRDALAAAPPARLVAFSDAPREIQDAEQLPRPEGCTALDLALNYVTGLRPGRTLVISDGEPDNEERALAAAEKVPGPIDVIYCGREDNARARAFMARLARVGLGRYEAHDIGKRPAALAPAVRALLGSGR